MRRVTAGDGCAGSSSWRARIGKHMDDPSPPVTANSVLAGPARVRKVKWSLQHPPSLGALLPADGDARQTARSR
jgi:hypothetical protein